MPRAVFDNDVRAKSGRYKNSTVVYMFGRDRNFGLSRSHNPNPFISEHQRHKGSKMKAVSALWKLIPDTFKADLRTYARAFNMEHQCSGKNGINAYAVFIMATLKLSDPIDALDTLVTLLGNTLQTWITRGFLRNVNVSQPFTAEIM